VGFEEGPESGVGIDFWGRSFVSDLNGQILKQASRDEEELLVCPLDLSYVERVRKGFSFPFRDRRVDSYGGLTKLFLDAEG
jgi:N-carbamoylputrescine amidase